jgi:glycosyltransferase involved in cell wall biosynthesis
MSRIKVLEMIDQPFLGGGQITLLSLAKGLDKDKFEILAASGGGGPLVDELGKLGVPHISIDIRKSSGPGAVVRIAAALRGAGIDLFHTHGGVAGLYGRLAAKKAGIPAVVHTLHGIHYLHYRNPLLKWAFIVLERRLSRFTDAVIFVSQADLRKGMKLRLAPAGKARLIRNGIDPAGIIPGFDRAAKKSQLGSDGRPLVVAVSRLHRQKGLKYLLRAVPLIREEIPAVKVVIAGGGPLESKLASAMKRLRIGESATLLGERKDAREVLAAADVFVLPSLWEGLPYVLVEAAALGKPIVATDIDGVREVVRSGETGVLVPPRDPGGLAAALILLLRDRDLAGKLGERARRDIPSAFALERMVRETEALYLEAFRNSG